MDWIIDGVGGINAVQGVSARQRTTLAGVLAQDDNKAEGSLFEAFLNSAINNIKTTNEYLSDAENEEIKFAMGETETAHDLTIALQKASTALQYTVSIRDKLMEAYKELMQMQI